MESAPQQRFTHPTTLCRRENSQLPCFQAIPNSCLPRAHFAKGCKNIEPKTLTTFRINTYEKHRGGKGGYLQTAGTTPLICSTWRLYPLCPHSIADTSRYHGVYSLPRALCEGPLPSALQISPRLRQTQFRSSRWTFSAPPTTRYPLPATHFTG
jgi:hypothetical protein